MEIPYNYVRCMASPKECPLAEHCLRHLTWQRIEESPDECTGVMVVNPLNPTVHYATERCTMYRNSAKVRFAFGMTRLYNNVEPHLRSWVRGKVMAKFSSRRTYFYCRAGRDRISPETQKEVAKVFKQCGIKTDPVFDKYQYDYVWD